MFGGEATSVPHHSHIYSHLLLSSTKDPCIPTLHQNKSRAYYFVIMSAPNAGRQSPEPQNQTGAQQQDVPAGTGKMDESKGKDAGKDNQTANLESNPKHILADEAEKKTSKG